MVRSKWLKPLWGVLACTSLAWGQGSSSSAQTMGTDAKERFVTVSETDKPGQRCKLLKSWQEVDGRKAYLVQSTQTGEFITVVEAAATAKPASTSANNQTLTTKIYHWGSSKTSPANAPVPPTNAVVYGTASAAPTPKVTAPKETAVAVKQATSPATPKATNWRESWGQADSTTSQTTVKQQPVSTPVVTQQVNLTSQPLPIPVVAPVPKISTQPPAVMPIPTPVVTPPVSPIVVPPSTPMPPMPPITQVSVNLPVAPVATETDDPFATPKAATVPASPTPTAIVVPKATTAPTVVMPPITPVPVTTAIVENTATSALPHADPTKADPLGKADLIVTKPRKNIVTLTPTVVVTPDKVKKENTVSAIPTKTTDGKTVTTIPTKGTETAPVPILPMGFGSVYGARRAGAEVVTESHQTSGETVVESSNQPRYSLFPALIGSHRNKPDGPGNAFTDGGIPPEILARGGGTNMPPPGVPMPPFDAGIAPGWANAFTPKGSTRPIPANFGPVQYPPNAFEDKLAHAMTPPYWAPNIPFNAAMAVPRTTPEEVSRVMTGNTASALPQVLATLKDALYPSQREEAAEKLGMATDVRKRPEVLANLIAAAQEDPAANVRAACVRSLVRLQADGPEVGSVVQTLRNDRDPLVRKEVEKMRLPVNTSPVSHQDNAIQPVSAKGVLPPIK